MCKVSLILPSLNVARFMDECLHSVIAQTLQDIEIICVDAGSTDGTLDIIRKYAAQDQRVRLVHSDRKSYGYQMNLGMRQATGEYIGIVETDDFVPTTMYEALYRTAVRENAEIVKADFYRFKTVGDRIERTYNRLDPSGAYYGRIIDPAREQQVFRFIMNTWSGIYLRRFLEENAIVHNETPGASYQDNGFWFKTFCCAKRVFFVDKPYYMNRRDNEASSVANPGKVYCMTEEWTYIERWLREDEARFQTFIGVYTLRKYHSLLITYHRIAPEYREEFIQHMANEMGRLLSSGEYSRSAFTDYEWRKLNRIVSSPLDDHRLCALGCSHLWVARILEKTAKRKRVSGAIRKADGLLDKAEIVCSWIKYEGFARTMRRIKWKNTKDLVSKEEAHG